MKIVGMLVIATRGPVIDSSGYFSNFSEAANRASF